ncbi:MAG: helix-turn-helix transcriptional regulator [Angelakisella sp.]|nr:helix-turn-helix transcriptional regulator [Angelakisella sp.]
MQNELNIGKTLVDKRREKGITQDQLASFIGVTKASVSKWETGQSYPDIAFLPMLATYFDISVDELINYKPQMTKNEIDKTYKRLSTNFLTKPFSEVRSEIELISKKYRSCYPLVLQMGILLLNYQSMVPEKERTTVFREIVEMFRNVKQNSKDFNLSKQANLAEATCFLMLGDGQEVVKLLKDYGDIQSEHNILALGYSMTGETEKAKEVSQIAAYQSLLALLQNLLNILRFERENQDRQKDALKRILTLAQAFKLDRLHPGTMFTVYLTSALTSVSINDLETALEMLQYYANLATSDIYPLNLKSDEFFYSIDDWLGGLTLSGNAPREEAVIKQSIIEAVEKEPLFVVLHENYKYENILKQLKLIIGG